MSNWLQHPQYWTEAQIRKGIIFGRVLTAILIVALIWSIFA